MGKRPPPSEQRIVLEKISWQKFEALLTEMKAERTTRFTFDRGRLELMHPLDEHERCHKLIESLILVLVDELELQVEGFKAPTLKRVDLQQGTEPDTAYYIQQVAQIRNRTEIDLATDPPPDLILEVSLSKSAIDKLPIYAAFGIPEVWLYVSQVGDDFLQGELLIYCLKGDRYVEAPHGLAFPFLPASRILEFLEQSDSLGLMVALRVLRDWLQTAI